MVKMDLLHTKICIIREEIDLLRELALTLREELKDLRAIVCKIAPDYFRNLDDVPTNTTNTNISESKQPVQPVQPVQPEQTIYMPYIPQIIERPTQYNADEYVEEFAKDYIDDE